METFTIHAGRARCAGGPITIGDQRFEPDASKAYFEFWCAHGFPVITSDGTAVYTPVVADHYRTMLHQMVNLGHMMESYGTADRDRVLGSVVAVEFPEMPKDGWGIADSFESAVGMHGVGVLHRACAGVQRILESKHSGERDWMVSMEIGFPIDGCAMLVREEAAQGFGCKMQGPEEFMKKGWSVYEMAEAPPMLQRTLIPGQAAIAPEYPGKVVMLMGGLRGPVRFEGLALTLAGKEPTARTGRFTGSMTPPTSPETLVPHLRRLLEITKGAS
ncbi:MAG: hypothetical protein IT581_14035 [Verrucomicrobiales bacterium]|nr:hypothetical protein [Verrucomicrobiales bacterium]